MHLHVVHETRYHYSPALHSAQHMACLRPLHSATQALLAHTLHISPTPQQRRAHTDVFGNVHEYFAFSVAHNELVVVADSTVRTALPLAPSTAQAALPWESLRAHCTYHSGAAWDSAAEFVFASPYVPRHSEFEAYALPSFKAGRPALQAAQHLMRRIYQDFSYESYSTEVSTPALETLRSKRGVCQDFAHVMLACLRAMGLAARYVSGYLLTQPAPGQPRLVGSDASHAWVSLYLPGVEQGELGCWIDLDPTNNRGAGEDYVSLATGRDFGDVSPLRGVIQGGAGHTLSVAVTVAPA